MPYRAYNKLYHKGKPMGQKFRVTTAPTKKRAISSAKRFNTQWNKWARKKRPVVQLKMVGVKRVKR